MSQSDPVSDNLKEKQKRLSEKIIGLKTELSSIIEKAKLRYQHVTAEKQADLALVKQQMETEIATVESGTEESELQTKIGKCMDAKMVVRQQISDIKTEINKIKSDYQLKISYYETAKRQKDSIVKKITKLSTESKELNQNLNQKEDYSVALKTFITLITEETLVTIAAKATDMMGTIPNVSGTTMEFLVERETKSGKIKSEIKPLIYKDGYEIEYRSLSGGQQAAVELCVDLALADVVSGRLGVYPQWLILDEPFDGLGDVDKESIHEILEQIAETKPVFVIDHSCQVKERFSSIFDIEALK